MNLRHLPAALLLVATAAQAADASYLDEASFVTAAGSTVNESFEGTAGRLRSLDPIGTAHFTISTTLAPIGVQTDANLPSPGYGASAADGLRYVSVYLPNEPQGSLRFTLTAPATAFGLYLIDTGETAGQVIFKTDTGTGNAVLIDYPPLLPDGNERFIGFTQTQAFSEVTLTVTGVDEAYGIDKVYVSAVPEPASAALLGLGLAGLWAAARRRG